MSDQATFGVKVSEWSVVRPPAQAATPGRQNRLGKRMDCNVAAIVATTACNAGSD